MIPLLKSQALFRVMMISLATVLAGFALWILAAELLRSNTRRLPMGSEAAAKAASAQLTAGWAARIGSVRGDLWTESAFTFATLLWLRPAQKPDPAVANRAREVVERALTYAPHDASLWLLAAGLGSQLNWRPSGPASFLNMSYYTGSNELFLTPLRLHVATHSSALTDDEVQRFVQRDIRMILTRWHQLKPALVAAHKGATPDAKRFLEAAIADVEPSFVATVRTGSP